MAHLLTSVQDMYGELMRNADPRVDGWFMMSTPWPSLVICLLYLAFVKMGPTIMADRKPVDLKKVLLVYNIGMVGLSTYCFLEFNFAGWLAGYSLGCQPVDYSRSPQALRVSRLGCQPVDFSRSPQALRVSRLGCQPVDFSRSPQALRVSRLGCQPVDFSRSPQPLRVSRLRCQPVDYSRSPQALRVSRLGCQPVDFSRSPQPLRVSRLGCQPVDFSRSPQSLRVGRLGCQPVDFSRSPQALRVSRLGCQPVDFSRSPQALRVSRLGCQPVDYSRSPQALRMLNVCWWFYFSKFIELLDTIFFIMRKKFNQVSFLHVFHHAIMPFSWWFGVKFVAGGFGTFHSMLNSFIHLVMYTYYGLAALGPQYQKYLWWKKYMTSMQIIQFILVTIHSVQLLFIDCNYPKFFVYLIGLYAVVFMVMFANFYVQTYKKSKPKSNGTVTNGTVTNRNVSNGMKHKQS
ncbi:very long chain fatty acid elongase 7-like isoform X2 [Mytilus edulis]|uniref:very long chain fatty acid elongase 7-like isoform X2 n=1 Tax=Mytilus edulis TaxID=6550 RepID=UPI0039EE0C94